MNFRALAVARLLETQATAFAAPSFGAWAVRFACDSIAGAFARFGVLPQSLTVIMLAFGRAVDPCPAKTFV
jgi:hypothetical protein